jgi:cytochrome oxidase Cu insertion factor (SCO1/SenC/PrrC family)
MRKLLLTGAVLAAAGALAGFGAQDGFERERGRASDDAKNALEGKTPPALAGEWFQTNGKALDWKALKGKVVILDFWAHW